MATISLCMIVRDEEDVLARCLDSVQDLVEEIIIVDTGSVDATMEIAKTYTDKVYAFPWQDDFAAARNAAFAKASKEYQMWMDADDVLLEEDRQKFRLLKEQLTEEIDLVMLPYHAAFDCDGRPTMTYQRERLLRRSMGYQWVGAVHEVIVPKGRIYYGDAAICHKKLHPGDPDRNLRIYTSMLQKGAALEARHQFYYGRELYEHGRYDEAIAVLEAFLQDPQSWVENKINACLDLSVCYTRKGQPEAALQILLKSFAWDCPRAEVCCAIGAHFIEQQQYPQAIYWYKAATRLDTAEKNGGFQQPDCYDFIPNLQLCVCYDRIGQKKQALQYHEKTKALKPNHPAVIYNEGYFYGASGNLDQS